MASKPKVTAPTPETIASYVKKNAPLVRQAQKPAHAHPESVREADTRATTSWCAPPITSKSMGRRSQATSLCQTMGKFTIIRSPTSPSLLR